MARADVVELRRALDEQRSRVFALEQLRDELRDQVDRYRRELANRDQRIADLEAERDDWRGRVVKLRELAGPDPVIEWSEGE